MLRKPIAEVEKTIIGNLKCPKCGGKVSRDGDDDISCFTCGWAGGEFITQGMSRGTGRKREGIYTKCLDCGTDIYVRPHRLENDGDDKEYRCRSCASKQSAKQPRKRITTSKSQAAVMEGGVVVITAKQPVAGLEPVVKAPEPGQSRVAKAPPPLPQKKKEDSWLKITTELIADWEANLQEIKDKMERNKTRIAELNRQWGELEDESMFAECDIEIAQKLVKAYKKKYPNNEVNITE